MIVNRNELFGDRIRPLLDTCNPINIKVTMRRLKDRYYVHFDGTKTYENPEDWKKFWVSFEDYVRFLLKQNGFENAAIKVKHETHVVAFIGTLFDFLKNTKDDLL